MSKEWHTGRVKKWFDGEGFGFVETRGLQEDAFIHISMVPEDLRSTVHIDTLSLIHI